MTKLNKKYREVEKILLQDREGLDLRWYRLRKGKSTSKKDANKFILGAIIDYQIPAQQAWDNSERLADEILGDPDNIWEEINKYSHKRWMGKFKQFRLHRFPKAHERIWKIGKRILEKYNGDTRNIWKDHTINNTLSNLLNLGMGKQISSMVIGALIDSHILNGKGDVKADLHVRRVLGRVFRAAEYLAREVDQVISLTHSIHKNNPWLLDRGLFLVGKNFCFSKRPLCTECKFKKVCKFYFKNK
ncbi:MAG: hypothetical protein GYA14_03510 [Ignavibacteria bacterium]|nr:hypothetical protein [Ignavibacteria bacterium]